MFSEHQLQIAILLPLLRLIETKWDFAAFPMLAIVVRGEAYRYIHQDFVCVRCFAFFLLLVGCSESPILQFLRMPCWAMILLRIILGISLRKGRVIEHHLIAIPVTDDLNFRCLRRSTDSEKSSAITELSELARRFYNMLIRISPAISCTQYKNEVYHMLQYLLNSSTRMILTAVLSSAQPS